MKLLSNGTEEGPTPVGASAIAPLAQKPRARPGLGLSAKLLLLTVGFVMLAEVLIFVPSIASFRVSWLMERLQAAQIAALAAEAAPGGQIPPMLRDELLKSAQVRTIAVKREALRLLVLSDDMPPEVDAHYDLRTAGVMHTIMDAVMVLTSPEGRFIRIIGNPQFGPGDTIEIVMPEAPLKAAMARFGFNILGLSVIISMVTASLVYLALNALLVRPMRRITESMVRFGDNPEDASRIIRPSRRSDEIGTAEHELARMQRDLSGTLQQKSHLAALGLAVSKISHDLRNMLANAQLISDRLGSVKDPAVERFTPKLIASLDRAIRLCTDTLRYGRASEAPPVRRMIPLAPALEEVREGLSLPQPGVIEWVADVPPGLPIDADADQLYRILSNLVRNSMQALVSVPGPHRITITAERLAHATAIIVRDDGPGIPLSARFTLFMPFQNSTRKGGTGLGLAIVAELVKAHGGTIRLLDEPTGAAFRIEIPDQAG